MPRLAQSWARATTPFATALPFLADGRLLVCGGHGSMHGAAMQDGIGVPQTSAFNPVEETWQQLPLMKRRPLVPYGGNPIRRLCAGDFRLD